MARSTLSRIAGQLESWLALGVVIAVIGGVLVLRPSLNPSATASPTAAASLPAEAAAPPATARPTLVSVEPTSPPTPAEEPTTAPTPAPPPVQTLAPAPTDSGRGGPIGPLMTPPPGWVQPTAQPGDVLLEGSLGGTLTAGGISVTASRIVGTTDGTAMCERGIPLDAPPTDGYAWIGFHVTATWSAFFLDYGLASSPGQYTAMHSCYYGEHPFTSGLQYEVWNLVPAGTETSAPITIGYFPNDASPEYRFTFR